MAQRVKALAAKPDHLSSIPETYIAGENVGHKVSTHNKQVTTYPSKKKTYRGLKGKDGSYYNTKNISSGHPEKP